MFPHVAKHARRVVNPPKDTWVAWATSKRGYKALPHFEVGMFSTHLFIIFAVIYESPHKFRLADYLDKQAVQLKRTLPDHFYWSLDHMDPGGVLHRDADSKQLKAWADKLRTVKKAELLCGLRLEQDDSLLGDGDKLLAVIEETFQILLPLYKGSF